VRELEFGSSIESWDDRRVARLPHQTESGIPGHRTESVESAICTICLLEAQVLKLLDYSQSFLSEQVKISLCPVMAWP
jgi:hypothetical protein